MDIWKLLFVIAQSNAQILLVGITGYVSARLGIITTSVQRGLSELTVKVLMPCLLFAQVAGDIDLETLTRLWPILVFMCLYALGAGLLGLIGGRFLDLSISNTKFIATGIMLNNLASISLALVKNLGSTDVIKILASSPTDTPKEITARGVTYILLATLIGNLLRWSIGAYLLRKDDNNNDDDDDDDDDKSEQNGLLVIPNEESSNDTTPSTIIKINNEANTNFERLYPVGINEATPLLFVGSTNCRSMGSRIKESVSGIFTSFKKFMNPPLTAALFAIVVGITPLKAFFFGEGAPLYLSLTKSMITMGELAIPLTLICLGAQLKNIPRSKDRQMFSAISWVMVCRFMIMPIIGLILVMMTRSFYLDDPMLWFVLIMLSSGPSAINCINLTQLTGAFQKEMATLLFYSYLIAAPMVTCVVVTIFMTISNVSSIDNGFGGR